MTNLFKNTQELISKLDEEYPISLNQIQHIVHQIFLNQQELDKTTISVILVEIFRTMRSLLIQGKTISIKDLSPQIKIINYKINQNEKIKVKIKTPKKII